MSTTAADPRAHPERLAEPGASLLHVALPKGRMHDGAVKLLAEAGISVRVSERGYRPILSIPAAEAKILKPQNVIEMLAEGTRDVGFAGADWVQELGVQDRVVELLDTELDPVRIVLAAPDELVDDNPTLTGPMPHAGPMRIATEYVALTKRWVDAKGIDATIVRSFGATEVFPPEDADAIVDNTATGSTLRANGLEIVDDLMRSSTRLYASTPAWGDPGKRARLEELVMLIRSVIEARKRAMLTLNVSRDALETVLGFLPCMRRPTVAELSAGEGYSVQVAVMRKQLTELIPRIKSAGGTDVIVQPVAQIVP